MNKLPPFLFSHTPDGDIMLRTQYPYYLATVKRFASLEEMAMTIAQEEPLAVATIPSCYTAITFAGTMGRTAAINNLNQEIEQVILAMRDFYLNNILK